MALSVLLLLLAAVAQAQKAPTATTDRIEAEALKAVFEKLDQKAEWNTTGDPCSGAATDSTDINDSSINPAIKCDCSDQNNTVCHITGLKIYDKDATGQIPEELRNLTHLTHLYELSDFLRGVAVLQLPRHCSNIEHGTIPSFIGELAAMQYMTFGINALSGSIPKELGNLTNLVSLGFSSNNFSGSLPSKLGSLFKLEELYIDSAGLSGELPSSLSKLTRMKILWASDNNFTGQIPDYIGSWNLTDLRFQGNSFQGPLPANLSNLVQLTNLRIGDIASGSSSSLAFISNMTSLNTLDLSFNNITGQCLTFGAGVSSAKYSVLSWFSTFYQADATNLGAASYHVTEPLTWGISNVGKFMDTPNGTTIINNARQFQATLDSELFQTARMSPSSLRYYGIGLQNGNYTVSLQFAEFGFEDTESWKSRGRRGERKEKDFDIKKEAGGKSYTAVKKDYIISVTKNFVEIHLFWAGKGTCCIPTQGYYGPTISALSLSPNFTPTIGNVAEQNSSTSKTVVIVAVAIGVTILGLVALVGIFLWRKKRRKLSLEQQELYSIVGRPNIFSYGELSGYLAPEYAMRGHMTEKVDVFAFGVVLLETLAGRPNYDDALEEDKVWRLYESDRALDIVDPDLAEFNSEEVLRAIHVALLCTQGSPHRRPSMSRVVAMLTGDAEVGEVAAKPSYITEWQIKGGGTTTTTTGSSSTSSSAANGQWSSAPPTRATSSPKMSSPFLSSVVDEGSC
uniref:non-specific serine/threonine protein kinase n=1 Tax=Oryza glumipatula TaxID=40148 RepID=A0A0D9ZQQ1_9ORYZ